MGSPTAAALNQASSLAYHLAGIQPAAFDKVLANHDREERFLLKLAADDTKHILGQHSAELEGEVLDRVGTDGHRDDALDDLHAVDILGVLHHLLAQGDDALLHEAFHLFA